MLPKSKRLRSNRDFRRVYAKGRSYVHPLLVLYVLPNPEVEHRFGFSVSKKLGGAVDRNRLKRRLREVCRARIEQIKPGFDFVVVARKQLAEAEFADIQTFADELFRAARTLMQAPEA